MTTGANGLAVASLTPENGVPANTWVSATATDLVTGDTSEFAFDLTAQPVSVQFTMTQFAVNSAAGVAKIEVERSGQSSSALVTVAVRHQQRHGHRGQTICSQLREH